MVRLEVGLVGVGALSRVNCMSMSLRDPVSAMAAAAQVKEVDSDPAVHARKETNMKTIPSAAIRPVLVRSHAIPSGSTEEGVEGSFSPSAEIGRAVARHSVVATAEGVADVASCVSAGAAGVDWSRFAPGLVCSDVRDAGPSARPSPCMCGELAASSPPPNRT